MKETVRFPRPFPLRPSVSPSESPFLSSEEFSGNPAPQPTPVGRRLQDPWSSCPCPACRSLNTPSLPRLSVVCLPSVRPVRRSFRLALARPLTYAQRSSPSHVLTPTHPSPDPNRRLCLPPLLRPAGSRLHTRFFQHCPRHQPLLEPAPGQCADAHCL